MKPLTLAFASLLLLAGPALAQTPVPDPLQDLNQDWQAASIAQLHLMKSIQALATELQADQAKIQGLEAENKKLKAAAPAAKDQAAAPAAKE